MSAVVAAFAVLVLVLLRQWQHSLADDADDAPLAQHALAAHVADMSGDMLPLATFSPNSANRALTCRHHFLPIWPFLPIFMSGNADRSIDTQEYYTTIIYPQ